MNIPAKTLPGQGGHPHGQPPVERAGAVLKEASGLLILVHGRGASAGNILQLRHDLTLPGVAYAAPQAQGHTWYPHSFLAPLEANEPGRSSGLRRLEELVEEAALQGLSPRQVMFLGFSQGACLVSEFLARHPQRYGGAAIFTGGLIGTPGELGGYQGDLDGTPVFLGAGDPDPHVPWARVEESAQVLRGLGAEVTLRRYPGLPHTLPADGIAEALTLLAGTLRPSSPGSGAEGDRAEERQR
ncbi:MAG: alpha/beta hydrolase [Acidobacteriota bacterium]